MAQNTVTTHENLRVIAEHIESLISEMTDTFVVSLKDGRSGRSINDRAELVLLEGQLAAVMRLIGHFEKRLESER